MKRERYREPGKGRERVKYCPISVSEVEDPGAGGTKGVFCGGSD